MTKLVKFCLAILLVVLSLTVTLSVNSPLEDSHSLAPEPAVESPPPESLASSPSESPMSSPPAPPPSEISPNPSPAESPSSPSPIPKGVSDITKGDNAEESSGSEGGMSGGKKAGIALGVIATAVLLGLGGLAYKKRRDNIRRSQFGYAARMELL